MEEHKASRWNHLYGRPAGERVKSSFPGWISSEYCLSELASASERVANGPFAGRTGVLSDSRRSGKALLYRSSLSRRMFETFICHPRILRRPVLVN